MKCRYVLCTRYARVVGKALSNVNSLCGQDGRIDVVKCRYVLRAHFGIEVNRSGSGEEERTASARSPCGAVHAWRA